MRDSGKCKGCLTGSIFGAFLGDIALPDFYQRELKLRDIILKVAKD